jgi:hypothetical protein
MANFDTLTETFSLGLSDQLITRKQGELTDKKVAASTVKAALADDAATVKTKYESNSDTNAFTDAHLTKLNGIATGAEVNVNADWSASSGDAQILNKPTIPTSTTQIAEGTNLYFTTSRANTSPAGQYAIAQTCELYVGASATAGGVDPAIVNPNLTDVGFVGIAPFNGSKVGLYDTSSSAWELRDVVATGLSLSGLTSGVVYDLYLGFVSNALALQSVAWSLSDAGASTRDVTPNYVNGVPLLPSDHRYRLVGTFRTSGTGTTSDSLQNRLVSNVVHKRWKRVSIYFNPTDYTLRALGVLREFGNNPSVPRRIHICSADPTPVSVGANISISSSGSLPTGEASARIGVSSTTTQVGTYSLAVFQTQVQRVTASFSGIITNGYNYLAVLETGHDGDNVTTNDPLMMASLMDGMVFL